MAAYVPEKFPHTWLPETVDLSSWQKIDPWYEKLEFMDINSPEELEAWLEKVDELNAVVNQEGVRRHVAMTCQTDDPEREAAHLAWVREIEPNLKPILNRIRKKYLKCEHRKGLDQEKYLVLDRSWENKRDLFRDSNIERETRLAELEQEYQKIIGAMTIVWEGETKTLAQLAPVLEETDRDKRERVWNFIVARRLKDKKPLDAIFDEMLKLRGQIAEACGFKNYVEYAYKSRERFDYKVSHVEAFVLAVDQVVMPLVRQIHDKRRETLGVPTLRPWDLAVDPYNRPPLRPFTDVDHLAKGTEAIFEKIDPELAAQFRYMRENSLLDLANRKGKAPGGYQTTFEDDRLPFIFMNAVGVDGDVRTLLHEGGHAFHALASRTAKIAAYRESPIEFCEVASMTMELFGGAELSVFYNEADAKRSYQQLLEGIVLILPWIATVDAFQHWIYTHPKHTHAERSAYWTELMIRFGGNVDWTDYPIARGNSWHKQLHIFLYPFYYIEYGIAQLGALGLWHRYLDDPAGALEAYKRGLALGGSRPLPELFQAARLPFDFSERTLKPVIDAVQFELAKLEA